MRALVFGAHGLVGRHLVAELTRQGGALGGALGHAECDIADEAAVGRAVAAARPTLVLNAAALTDLERAEREPDLAFAVNALGPERLARAASRVGARFLHLSTDFVFDGQLGRAYDEFDAPSPQSVYARSKLAGERLVQAAHPEAIVARVGGVYGRGGRGFPSRILERLHAGERLRVDDVRRCAPTWVVPLAALLVQVAATASGGLYHVTAAGETSWAGFARRIAAALGAEGQIAAVASEALPLQAVRPLRPLLEARMLRLRGFPTLPPWQRLADDYLRAEGITPTDAIPSTEPPG